MRIWIKIYILCLVLYIIVLNISGTIMIERNYTETVTRKIQQTFQEEESIKVITDQYFSIKAEQGISVYEDRMEPYSSIMDSEIQSDQGLRGIYSKEGAWVELLNNQKEVLISTFPYQWNSERRELDTVLSGNRNYILRSINGRNYLFVTDALSSRFILTLIKDITYVHEDKKQQFLFLIRMEIIGLILLALITPFISRFLTRSVEELTKSTKRIISGNFAERVEINAKDEIGVLAAQFNVMASEVEGLILELQDQGERKQKFIDNLIHEIRTPLTSIIGYSDFLLNQKFNEEILIKSLKNINSEGKRLLYSADKLMQMILLKNMNIARKEEQDVKQLLCEVAEDMKAKANAKGIKLMVETEDLNILMDRDLIKEVLINLVDNAIKFSGNGSKIVLGANIVNQNKTIVVKDEGKGIHESEYGRILEPFYKVDRARARKDGGAGLGLAICDEIVKAHGAKLHIQSEVGKGTQIEILF